MQHHIESHLSGWGLQQGTGENHMKERREAVLNNSDHLQQNLPDWSNEVRNNLSLDIEQRTPSKAGLLGKEQTTAMTIIQQLDQATQRSRETRNAA